MLGAASIAPGAIKTRYGGTLAIRLNEPTSFSLNTANYSNQIFCSLIYENFFYLNAKGEIFSNLFQSTIYDSNSKVLALALKDNLSFSNGKPLTANHILISLKIYLSQKLLSSSKLSKIVKNIRLADNQVLVELFFDTPDILSMLAAPELVVMADTEQSQAFSGPFYPDQWEKSRFLILKANPFYPGGRTYLDAVKMTFTDDGLPEIFLAKPAITRKDYREFDSGIFQNIYLCFPQPDVGQNTRIALFTLMQRFNEASGLGFAKLHSLTRDDESPVSIQIKTIPAARVTSILKYADIKLYILSSLTEIENSLNQFLKDERVKIETLFIDDNQFSNFLETAAVKFLLIDKIFQKKNPIEEKISQILKETSFSQFNEKYLRMLSELQEVAYIHNQELLLEQVAKINEAIIRDGFILPLFQKHYSLYLKNTIKGAEVDGFGRPLLHRATIGNE